jgi:hypothetical protein
MSPASCQSARTAGSGCPQPFVSHEDRRVVAYYAPFGCLNRHATVAWRASRLAQPLVLKSFTVVRSYIVADPPFGEARKLGAAVGAGCPGSRRS